MSVAVETRPPRLNPFAFPTDTDFRFGLLIVAAISASLFFSSVAFNRISDSWQYVAQIRQQCDRIVGATGSPNGSSGNSSLQNALDTTEARTQCMAPVSQAQGLAMLGGVALLLGIAGILYWFYPVWKLRREGLEPFTAADDPDLVAAIAELCRAAGLSYQPTILTNTDMTPSGLAFGRWGRYYLVLNAGLIIQNALDPDFFRAVAFHELAHLRNGDVDKTYFTLALWYVFAAATALFLLVDFLIPLPSQGPGDIVAPPAVLIWTTALLVGLVYLIRNGVLRVREVYADLQASVWDGSVEGLSHALDSQPPTKPGLLERLRRVHPDPSERRRLLDDTTPLFGIGFWEAFYTGVLIEMLLPNIDLLISDLIPNGSVDLPTYLPALAITPLAAGIVGLGTLRAAFVALMQGKSLQNGDRLALGLALGVIVGIHVSTVGVLLLLPQINPNGLTGASVVVFEVAWGVLVVVGVTLLFRWFGAAASVLAEVAVGVSSPRWVNRAFIVIAGALLALVLGIANMVYTLRTTGGTLGQPGGTDPADAQVMGGLDLGALGPWALVLLLIVFTFVLLTRIVTLPVVALLWCVPLAGVFRAPGAIAAQKWVFLDPALDTPVLQGRPPLRPGLALLLGVAAGAIVWLVIWGLFFASPGGAALVELSLVGMTALSLLAQFCVAWAVAARVERLSVVHALFAANIVGVLTVASWLILILVTRTPLIVSADTWVLEANILLWGGMLLALPAAAIGAGLGRRGRRRRKVSTS